MTKAGVGTNRYSYSFNDPVNLSDPNGNIIPALIAIAVVALVASSADPANASGQSDRTLPPNGVQNMGLTAGAMATGGVAVPLVTRAGATGVRSALAAETVLDVTACARGDTAACATIALPGVPGVANNAIASAARQRENARLLQLAYPDARIQNEVYLRTANGRRATDPLTGIARRIDHAVIDDATGTVITLRETTSMTANKTQQQFLEQNVRNANGTFIHDRRTGRLIDVSSTPTIVDRLP